MFSCCRCHKVKKMQEKVIGESTGQGEDLEKRTISREKCKTHGDLQDFPLNEIRNGQHEALTQYEIAPKTTIQNRSNSVVANGSVDRISNEIEFSTTTISNGNCSLEQLRTSSSKETTCEIMEIPKLNEETGRSCILRRESLKSSIKKRVNIKDTREIISSSGNSIDDDDVFSDSMPAKLPRGDMCAPYIKNCDPVTSGFPLPAWFEDGDSEFGGLMEPPVTPVGRDELELRRHRLYSDLLRAARAASEHRVRFDPFGPDIANEDNSDVKSSFCNDLEALLSRLECAVVRLENYLPLQFHPEDNPQNSQLKRDSFDIEEAELPPLPRPLISTVNDNGNLDFGSIGKISSGGIEETESKREHSTEAQENKKSNMSVAGYEDIISGPLAQFVSLSNKIGGDVAQQAGLVKLAFNAQLEYVKLATQAAQPPQEKQMQLLKPTSDQISAIQTFREKNRTSPFFNHLSAISESIPALGWVLVSPTPGPHVKEMNDAGQFYTNRVLKDWKEKNPTHVEWARSWIQTLTQLQQYIKQYHTTGLVWSGKGSVPPPPPSAAGCPPPPPPPIAAFENVSLGANDERSALFAEINQGEGITKKKLNKPTKGSSFFPKILSKHRPGDLKKVTDDMQTHKNPTLRTGPAPFKAPQQKFESSALSQPSSQQLVKEPVFMRDGKKWLIEYQKSNPNLKVENAEMNNVVYMFRCENSTLTVKGKVNSVILDSCKKCSILFDSVVASVEFVNCQSIQMQVLGKVPTISIDKTDGCQMYLSKESLNVEIISSKSSEMNVLLPKGDGDYIEQPIPEQYKTTIRGNSLLTICVESVG